jgi:hypothetical protein
MLSIPSAELWHTVEKAWRVGRNPPRVEISRIFPFFVVAVQEFLYLWSMFDKNDPRHQGYFASKDGKRKKFDFNLRRSVPDGGYTKKQRRAFQRLMSDLTVGKSRRERLRFMALTSSPESKGRDLHADFRALKMQIYRKFHFKMKYWKIRTNEGNEVLHIVFRGKYIPQGWLSAQ